MSETHTIEQPIGPEEAPSTVVVRAIAVVSNSLTRELEPLHQTIDGEALDTILQVNTSARIRFEHAECWIIADGEKVVIEFSE